MLSRNQTMVKVETPGEDDPEFAGDCFWCLEAGFREVDGVEKMVSGYTGRTTVNPTYRQVFSGLIGHAKAVQVSLDPARVSYRELLAVFFYILDPTTLNRQGADTGTQYRSAVFYQNERQRAITEQCIIELNRARLWERPIVTQLVPTSTFYPAEDYHQEYFSRNPENGYCRMIISPKVNKIRKQWAERLK